MWSQQRTSRRRGRYAQELNTAFAILEKYAAQPGKTVIFQETGAPAGLKMASTLSEHSAPSAPLDGPSEGVGLAYAPQSAA